jgi:signal transduction histidine kinase
LLLFVVMGLCTAAIFLFGLQRAVQGGWQELARPLVADYLDRLAAEIGSPPDAARAAGLTRQLPLRVRIEGPAVHYDSHAAKDLADEHGEPSRRRWRDRDFDAAAWGLVRATPDGHRITFGLARPAGWSRTPGIGWLTLAALLLAITVAYFAARHLLRPLKPIGEGVERFGRGEFGTSITVRRRDELGELAGRINEMAARLHGMLEAKRSLLLAISHELRSPLTRARLNAELLPEQALERAALLRDIGEMSELVSTLLESERLGEGHRALHTERTDLAALAREVIESRFAQALVTLEIEPALGTMAEVDPVRLKLLLRNLLDNALRHGAGAATAPQVFLRREADGRLALGVRDHGPGASPEQLARLGDAFYRPDSARTRAAGGVGLGLHLCRLVAQAHGGELRLRPAEPGLEAAMVWSAASVA